MRATASGLIASHEPLLLATSWSISMMWSWYAIGLFRERRAHLATRL
jgi:hypothetical protein